MKRFQFHLLRMVLPLLISAALTSTANSQIAIGPIVGTKYFDNSDYDSREMPFLGIQTSFNIRPKVLLSIEYFNHGSDRSYEQIVPRRIRRKTQQLILGFLYEIPTGISMPKVLVGPYIGYKWRHVNGEFLPIDNSIISDPKYRETSKSLVFIPSMALIQQIHHFNILVQVQYAYSLSDWDGPHAGPSKHSMQLLSGILYVFR